MTVWERRYPTPRVQLAGIQAERPSSPPPGAATRAPQARIAGFQAGRPRERSRPANTRPSSFCAEAQPESQNPGTRILTQPKRLGPATTRRMTRVGWRGMTRVGWRGMTRGAKRGMTTLGDRRIRRVRRGERGVMPRQNSSEVESSYSECSGAAVSSLRRAAAGTVV